MVDGSTSDTIHSPIPTNGNGMTSRKNTPLRARILIFSEAVLEEGSFEEQQALFKVNNATKFIEGLDQESMPDNFRILDIIFVSNSTIQSSFSHALNLLDSIIDKISYIGYSKVEVRKFYSLCPLTTERNDQFEILVPQYSIQRQREQVRIESLRKVQPDKSNVNALRLLRSALNSSSSEERLINLYSALEWLADKRTTETIKTTCSSCGTQADTGRKATSNYLTTMFRHHQIEKKQSDDYRKLRAKIAHGSGKRHRKYLEDVATCATHLEEILIKELDTIFQISEGNSGNVVVRSVPYFVHTCRHDQDDAFTLLESEWIAPVKFTQISSRVSKNSMSVGAPLASNRQPNISPISWPNYEND